MTVVIDDQFAASVTGWATIGAASAVAWSSGSAPGIDATGDDQTGRMVVSSGDQAERVFSSPITSGITRLDVWVYDPSSTTGTTHDALIYLDYLSAGSSPASATSAATIAVSRNASNGATSSVMVLQYRNASGFVAVSPLLQRSRWHKISVVVDESSHTYDLYLDDVLWERSVSCPNGAWTQLTRIVVVGQASAPDLYVSNVRVESDWSVTESVLIDHTFTSGATGEIETITPTTSIREAYPQPFHTAADAASVGSYTVGANGAVPDTSQTCLASLRCLNDGVLEIEFLASAAGVRYLGQVIRMWDFPSATGAGGGVFRISSSDSLAKLFLPDSSGNLSQMQSVSATLTANTVYTLKTEMRGRYLICSYKAAAIGSGSYTQLFAHKVTSGATGGRGMLAEEICGPYLDTTVGAATNYVRRMRFTGAIPSTEETVTVGGLEVEVNSGALRGIYATGSSMPQRNLAWSRGIQFQHRSRADGAYAFRQQKVIDAGHVKSWRQRASNLTEYEKLAESDSYVTLLRRGPWISDGITAFATGENFAPDWDLRPELWDTEFRYVGASGSGSLGDDVPFHDWVHLIGGGTPMPLPLAFQSLTAYGSGQEYRFSEVGLPVTNATGSVWQILTKYEGTADPISRVMTYNPGSMSANTAYRIARGFLVRPASGLSDSELTTFRDDVANPATLTFSIGSAKTDSAGDENTDGYNERHGWYEVNCTGGLIDVSVDVPTSYTRYGLAFRLWSWSSGNTGLLIDGAPASRGADYVIEDVGGGCAVLQLLGDITADTQLTLAVGVTSNRRRRVLICGGAV